jgi:drug/metabolite transporter (DMT)-like permease
MSPDKRHLSLTYIAILIAMFFWGFSFIWTKMLLQYHQPLSIVTMRLIISSLFLVTIGLVFKKLKPVKAKDFGPFLLMAFFQPFLYFIGETIGLNYVSATVSSVLIATIPLFSPVATWLFFGDKLKIVNLIGILVSILGVILLLVTDDFVFDASFIGILLMGLAVFSAIGYSILVIKMAKKYNIYSIITYQNLLGIILFMPFFLYFNYEHFINVKITAQILKPLFALSIFASSLAFMLFTYGVRELGIVKANAMSNLIPVFTAIFSFFLLNEKLSVINFVGISIVLCGLFLSQLKKKLHLQYLIIPFKRNNKSKK